VSASDGVGEREVLRSGTVEGRHQDRGGGGGGGGERGGARREARGVCGAQSGLRLYVLCGCDVTRGEGVVREVSVSRIGIGEMGHVRGVQQIGGSIRKRRAEARGGT